MGWRIGDKSKGSAQWPAARVHSRADVGRFLHKHNHMSNPKIAATALSVLLSAAILAGQTKVTPPDNKYTSAQDVELGLDAAAQARQQLPIMRDGTVTSYVEDVGERLVDAIPRELR